ncbi:LamB/YcsF family protein [Paraburkholderia caledonica]|uniref:UPF0271 protein n=1 Tax=Paraburkholderia caledonica TaxID=134536 RepID=A0AB73IMM2_9BURK|nr:UPF0271 protein [Paraburkholderia caledonica]
MNIDLNSDLAEGFGQYRAGDDFAMLDVVTSANIACGFHAGDPHIMADVMKRARDRRVAIGAHPGYPDIWGFGRRALPFSISQVEHLIAYQVSAAQGIAALTGHKITFVKPHGALGNLADENFEVADAVARAIRAVDSNLGLVATALGQLVPAGEKQSLRVYHEVFADRQYRDDGLLQPRSEPGAVIHDPAVASQRIVQMLESGSLTTITGKTLPTPIHTVCVHGDTPDAVTMAHTLRAHLEKAGVTISPFAPAY